MEPRILPLFLTATMAFTTTYSTCIVLKAFHILDLINSLLDSPQNVSQLMSAGFIVCYLAAVSIPLHWSRVYFPCWAGLSQETLMHHDVSGLLFPAGIRDLGTCFRARGLSLMTSSFSALQISESINKYRK